MTEEVLGSSSKSATSFRVAGAYVAYKSEECDRGEECTTSIFVVNGVTGRYRPQPGPVAGVASALRVNADGVAAYIDTRDETIAVRAVTRSSALVLAESTEIDPSSLALGNGWIYWTEADRPRSASI